MTALLTLVRSRWLVPIVAGALIVASFVTGQASGGPWADALMIAAAVVAGAPIARAAVNSLKVRVVSIDLLVSVAAIGAIAIANYWEAAAVTFLFAVGHALEIATLNKTRAALAELVKVAPDEATVLRDGVQIRVPAHAVRPGETVLVKHGSKVPVDGVVIDGVGAIDEAPITGESIPVEKAAGDRVFAGTVSTGGLMRVEARGVGADTTLARIIHRVEEAQDAKAKTQAFIDRFSRWYTPGIIVLAIIVGLVTRDVVLALTLLVIGCPGALVISIPGAIVAGIGRGARDGILIKGGEYLETAAKIDVVALDKTGTLTEGRPQVTDVLVLDNASTADAVLQWAARIESGSNHPLAAPILAAAADRGLVVDVAAVDIVTIPGKGMVATIDGTRAAVGNRALVIDEAGHIAPQVDSAIHALATAGRTPMSVVVDRQVIGVIGVADQVRTDAAHMVSGLRGAGVRRVLMLTGDAAPVAEAVARDVGITEVYSSLLPEDKLDVVRALQAEGHVVAMVGDGVNDAPALATANIGVAMGAAGAGVAIETADIALMKDDLLKLPRAVLLARRTVAVMHQNVAVAMVTVAALLLGVIAGGVTMAIGMLVHEVSVLAVIANAMRLLKGQRPDVTRPVTTQELALSAAS